MTSDETFAASVSQVGHGLARLAINRRVVREAWQRAVVDDWARGRLRNGDRFGLLSEASLYGVDMLP